MGSNGGAGSGRGAAPGRGAVDLVASLVVLGGLVGWGRARPGKGPGALLVVGIPGFSFPALARQPPDSWLGSLARRGCHARIVQHPGQPSMQTFVDIASGGSTRRPLLWDLARSRGVRATPVAWPPAGSGDGPAAGGVDARIGKDGERLEEARRALDAGEGLVMVLLSGPERPDPADPGAWRDRSGLDHYHRELDALLARSFPPGRSGLRIVLVSADPVLPRFATPEGSLGALEDGVLVHAGPGVATGALPLRCRPANLYPTFATLLGLDPPAGMDGRVVAELLPGGRSPGDPVQ